jgi:hypothetical protein
MTGYHLGYQIRESHREWEFANGSGEQRRNERGKITAGKHMAGYPAGSDTDWLERDSVGLNRK